MGKITSGKGTQAEMLKEKLNLPIFSTGDQVRSASKLTTPFGKRMKETYEEGLLIPEWIAEYWMMHGLLVEHNDSGLIFEGVAKKPDEARLLHEIHEWLGRSYVVFNLEIPDEVVKERTVKRSRDEVDSLKVMETRLSEYRKYTEESLNVFREKGTLIDIDGTSSIEEVKEKIFKHLGI